MKIDNSIRRQWGFLPNGTEKSDQTEFSTEADTYRIDTAGAPLESRCRVTAQEWLPTWRTIE